MKKKEECPYCRGKKKKICPCVFDMNGKTEDCKKCFGKGEVDCFHCLNSGSPISFDLGEEAYLN